MIEKNRDILKKALNELPRRKAARSNWDKISGSLEQMEAGQFLSRNVSSLPKHKAPASAWNAIEKGIKAPWYSLASNGIIKIGTVALIAVALVFSIYVLIPDHGIENDKNAFTTSTDNNVPEEERNIPEGTEESNEGKETLDKKFNGEVLPEADTDQKIRTGQTEHHIQKESSGKVSNESDGSILSGQNSLYETDSQLAKNEEVETNVRNHGLIQISPKGNKGFDINMGSNSFIRERNKAGSSISGDDYRREHATDVYLGGFYSLINFQNVRIEEMDIPESLSSFGLELMLNKGKFFYKTGISYLSWKEKASYIIDYKQNELVYSYNYVDSAFINPISGETSYYTSPKDVYDSIDHQRPDEIKYQYKLLQIPFIIGYKIFESRHYLITLNGGMGMDIRIGGRQYTPVFNHEQSTVIGINNHLDYRFDMNYRILGGITFRYKISDRLSFYLEPSYHRYLKSVYRNASLRSVTYFEIKTGFLYKF